MGPKSPKKKTGGKKKSQRKLDVEPEIRGPDPLPPALETKCREGFALFDEQGTGAISFEVCSRLLEVVGENMPVNDLKDFLKSIGKDIANMKDVSWQDFYELMQNLESPAAMEQDMKLVRAFQVLDTLMYDGHMRGYLKLDDCRNYLLKCGAAPMTVEEFDAFVEEVKTFDKLQISAEDGQIIFYEEFATGAQEAMKAKGAKKKKK